METLLKDIRYAVKLLWKQKSFTAAALLTLALCIGANTAIFSVLNAVLLRPLPYAAADRLVAIYNTYPEAGVERGSTGVPDYYDRLEHATGFTGLAMMQTRGMTIGESGRPERITGRAVTPSFFRMLGVAPVAGRTFTPEEGEPGGDEKAVLSWGLWQERFGGGSDAIGSSIRINDVQHTIVGVMPRDFVFEDPDVRIWVPLAFTAEMRGDDRRHNNSWEMIGLRGPDTSLEEAQAQIDAVNARNDERFPQFRDILQRAGFRTVVADYHGELTRDIGDTLWLLQGGVLLVLLIGCVNIANLVLVRATARHRELATRSALGAGQRRLVRQLLTEGIVLAVTGGALGVLLAWLGVNAFADFAAGELPRGTEIGLDLRTLIAAVGVTLFAGMLFGAIPVLRLMHADLSTVFRDEGRTGTASRATQRWRSGLVVAQVSLAFALLVGAGLMIASFVQTARVDVGFERANVLTASVSMPVTRYPDDAARRTFTDRVLERVRAIPGVTVAAATNVLLFGDDYNSSVVTPEGYTPAPEESLISPINSQVSDNYFETMGIELVAGRTFTAGDRENAQQVAIIDEDLAARFFPGRDPLGARITQGVPGVGQDDQLVYRTIVGVVRRVRASSMTEDQPPGHFYVPLAQRPTGRIFLTVKTAVDPLTLENAVRRAVAELDPDMPAYDIRSMEERVAGSMTTDRLRMLLITGFGALALFLAAVGLYGVLAYSVAQRSAEIGIRMALGSSAIEIFRMVVGQGARLVALGLGLGLAASIALTRLVQSMLYGVSPTDPVVFAGVLTVLAITALVACIVPARRAMSVDPLVAMRTD